MLHTLRNKPLLTLETRKKIITTVSYLFSPLAYSKD